METRPIAPEIWEKLPPEVQAYILVLETGLRQALEKIAQREITYSNISGIVFQSYQYVASTSSTPPTAPAMTGW
ncbi:MAG: hypothetical protein ACLFUU_04450 [Desulfobacteraceae bacterium]